MNTILVEIRRLSEPLFDEAELGLPADDPAVLLLGFPLDNDLCHQIWKQIQDMVINGSLVTYKMDNNFFSISNKKIE